ncbi:MAG: PKD repeat protein [Cryomorphaceae bacterium]|jgi:PKD repeat protein
MKLKKIALLFFILGTFTSKLSAQVEPDGISGLELWMRSSDNITIVDDLVTNWQSVTDISLDFTQSDASRQGMLSEPLEELNGFQSLFLDGINDLYSLSSDVSDARTIFLLFKHATGSSIAFEPVLGHTTFFDFHGVNGTPLFRPTSVSNGILSGTCRVNQEIVPATEVQKPIQYSMLTIRSTQGLRFNSLSQDRAQSRFWAGSFVEIIAYSDELSDEEIISVEEYIINRYAPPVDLGPDFETTGFCPFNLSLPNRYSNILWSNDSNDSNIEITEPGIYWVEATNIFGITSSDTIEINYPGTYLADFSLCSDKDSIWTSGILGFALEWQDGSDQPSFTISEEGTYSFTATDGEGCEYQSPTVAVAIDSFPNNFGVILPLVFCEGNELTLTESEGIQELIWSNNSTDLTITPTMEGEYWAQASNITGCFAQDTVEVVFNGTAPNTNFSSVLACSNFGLDLSDQSVPSDGSTIVDYSWTFNDSEFSNEENTSIQFASGGEFEIKLSIMTSTGCEGSYSNTITVPGLLSYSLDSSTLCANQTNEIIIDASVPFDNIETLSIEVFDNNGMSIIFTESNPFTLPSLPVENYNLVVTSVGASGCVQASEGFIEVVSEFFCLDPASSGALNLWLDGSENVAVDVESVTSWGDKSGNGLSAISPSAANQPSYIPFSETLNSKGVLRFDGINDFMDFGELTSIRTLFLVYKHVPEFPNIREVLLGHPSLFQFHGSTENSLLFSPSNTSVSIRNGVTRANGIAQDPLELDKPIEYEILTINPTDSLTAQYITNDRGNSGRYWDGDYAEILLFKDSLADETIFEIEQYLRYKYAPPIDLPRQIRVEYGFCDTALVGYQPWFRTYDWSTGSQDSTIQVNESGWYNLIVTDLFGYTSTDSVEVIFDGTFGQESETLCALETLTYSTGLDSDEYSLDWSTDETSSSIVITEEGFYSVTISDTLGCIYSPPEIFIDVDSFPITANIIDIPTFCLGNDLFLSSGFEEAETYLWNTDEVSPFIQPQSSGEYWVEATNANGCVGRDTVEVTIAGIAPDAAFNFGPPCENNDVLFNDLTTPEGGTVAEWAWTFENTVAGMSTAESPAIFYSSVGTYPVALTVTLDNGCTGTTRDTVLVNPLPLVNFSAPLICSGNEVFFESLTGVPGNGTIALQEWSFGNGTFDTGAIGSTTFEVPGFTTVTHIVTTGSACRDSLLRNIEVLGSPVADFDVTDVCLGQSSVFNENVDVSVSGPVFYNWQFGDGFFSNFPNTSHEYAQGGVYEVTLTATGNNVGVNGCVDQETKTIRVYEPPVGALLTTDACIGAATELVDVSVWEATGGLADEVIARTWTVIDGPTGIQEGFIGMDSVQLFIPEAAGIFEVGLELETAAGCSALGTGSFLVQAIPSAVFALELPAINPPFTSIPNNLSEDGINFEWLINGEIVSTEFEPTLTFDSAGDYEVLLVATNDLNCNDTAMAMYTVIVPEYDIALIELQYQTQGSTLVLSAIISNNGNVAVETFDTEIEVGRDIQFTLESKITIPPGALVDYPLGSDIGYLAGRDLPFACMRISNPNGQMETDTTNNYLCIGLNEQLATFATPYPNPAKNEVNLTFVLPEDGPLNVEITSSDGRLIEAFVLDLKEGLNTVDYPLIGWAEGMYFLKFSYRNQEEVFRLVVAR